MRKRKCPGFVAMPWEVLNSHAYFSLTFSAKAVLPFFLGKPKRFFNEKEYLTCEFSFSYQEAEKLGFSKATHSRNIQNLIEVGFIDPISKGGLRGTTKASSIFKLSLRYKEYGASGFKKVSWKSFIEDKTK